MDAMVCPSLYILLDLLTMACSRAFSRDKRASARIRLSLSLSRSLSLSVTSESKSQVLFAVKLARMRRGRSPRECTAEIALPVFSANLITWCVCFPRLSCVRVHARVHARVHFVFCFFCAGLCCAVLRMPLLCIQGYITGSKASFTVCTDEADENHFSTCQDETVEAEVCASSLCSTCASCFQSMSNDCSMHQHHLGGAGRGWG